MISAVILAAGKATRAGEAKFIWPIDGIPAIRKLSKEILKTNISELLIITGAWKKEAEETLAGLDVKFCYNKDFNKGQAESLKIAIKNVDKRAKAIMFFLADQPFITSHIISKVINSYTEFGFKIVVPSLLSKWKTPVLLDKKTWEKDILNISGDKGARDIVNNNLNKALFVSFDVDDIFFEDFDTKEEYEGLILKYAYNTRCG